MKKLACGFLFVVLMIGCAAAEPMSDKPIVKENEPAVYHSEKTVPEQVPYGYYCCDAQGWRRCMLPGPAPLGAGCFCYGQGYGFTCP